jgi:hypothetical protein
MININKIVKNYKSGFKKADKLRFASIEKQDVYNITAPFKIGEETFLLGRVEARETEGGSKTIFFRKKGESWQPEYCYPVLTLEDPFLTKIKDFFILGGVQVTQRPNRKFLGFRTVFYKGKEMTDLKEFAYGPWGMKGIRVVELPNGKIGVFTRPRGKKGARGNIGFTIVNSLDELKPRFLSSVELIPERFAKGEWGGVNQVFLLKNGKIGALGHAARYSNHKKKDSRMRFYYPIAFCFDPETKETSNIRLLVRRAELPEGDAKRPDLYNVVYPGGITRNNDGTASLYAGVSDAEAYEIIINDPYTYYEHSINEKFESKKLIP